MVPTIAAASAKETAPFPSFLSSGVVLRMTLEPVSRLCRLGGREAFMTERWLPVVGYEDFYEISNKGRVRSLSRSKENGTGTSYKIQGQILKSSPCIRGGYLTVNLCRFGTKRTTQVHQIVAAAFIGPRPPKMDIAHFDGDHNNNDDTNLRYATRIENCEDRLRHGRNGRKLNRDQIVDIRHRRISETGRSLAKEFSVSESHISAIKNFDAWGGLS
jgi:hypothetical protein